MTEESNKRKLYELSVEINSHLRRANALLEEASKLGNPPVVQLVAKHNSPRIVAWLCDDQG